MSGCGVAGRSAALLAVGYTHACALIGGGGVACWGSNSDGQLGTGDLVDTATPKRVELYKGVGKKRQQIFMDLAPDYFADALDDFFVYSVRLF